MQAHARNDRAPSRTHTCADNIICTVDISREQISRFMMAAMLHAISLAPYWHASAHQKTCCSSTPSARTYAWHILDSGDLFESSPLECRLSFTRPQVMQARCTAAPACYCVGRHVPSGVRCFRLKQVSTTQIRNTVVLPQLMGAQCST
jgi:hypothetical protein